MPYRRINIGDYANKFGLTCICGSSAALKREIKEATINRPGLELAGFFEYPRSERIIFFGNHEVTYITNMSEEKAMKAYEFLLDDQCPGLVICQGRECPSLLLDYARKKDFPIFTTSRPTNDFNMDSVIYLQECLAPAKSIHAAFVEIYSMGVLILGESGIGKSETVLELIKRGHRLISDDRVDVSFIRGKLYGESPELLLGMMEVRGIGIIDVTRMFGINSLVKRFQINYAIKLSKFDPNKKIDRLGNAQQKYEILGTQIPLLEIPVYAGRSISEIIEVAITNLKLKEFGFDSTFEFEKRFNEILERKQ